MRGGDACLYLHEWGEDINHAGAEDGAFVGQYDGHILTDDAQQRRHHHHTGRQRHVRPCTIQRTPQKDKRLWAIMTCVYNTCARIRLTGRCVCVLHPCVVLYL